MTAAAGSPRVTVVDDFRFVRTVVPDVLKQGEIEVVGEAADGRRAVELVAGARLNVVRMDHQMPEMSWLEAGDYLAKSGGVVSAGRLRLGDQLVRTVRSGAQADVAPRGGVDSVADAAAGSLPGRTTGPNSPQPGDIFGIGTTETLPRSCRDALEVVAGRHRVYRKQ